jgi:gamma-glutamylcyclotransferase (GGCT)/AIG2-like uncharacterized protein YtfP
MTQLYFAYGANLNVEEMSYRCPGAVPVHSFVLTGWQLLFSHVATIVPAYDGQGVPGAIWAITDTCEDSLDGFEGYPYLYTKKYLETTAGKLMFYVMHDVETGKPPSLSYLNTITRGYADWGLDQAYLDQAVEQCRNANLK